MGSKHYYTKVDLSPVAQHFTVVLLAVLLLSAAQQEKDWGGTPMTGQELEEARAIRKLTGKEHTLYRDKTSLFGNYTHVLMDGRKIRVSGTGPNTVAEWA